MGKNHEKFAAPLKTLDTAAERGGNGMKTDVERMRDLREDHGLKRQAAAEQVRPTQQTAFLVYRTKKQRFERKAQTAGFICLFT